MQNQPQPFQINPPNFLFIPHLKQIFSITQLCQISEGPSL